MPYYQNRRSDHRGHSPVNRNAQKGRQPKKDYIHPSKFIQSAKPQTQAQYSSTHTFAEFNVDHLIKNNLRLMGYSEPTPIQDQAIPIAIEGRDIVGIANTGTGKTAAFAIPLLHKLLTNRNSQALILAPTRELAQQIEEQCRKIAKGSGLDGVLLIGGVAMAPQLRDLRYNPRIIIGTPGRIKDHIERRSLDLAKCNLLVLDEVDRMLDMGFLNDIHFILGKTNNLKQSFYFSATLDDRVKSIIDSFSNDPVVISVKSGQTSDNIDQNIITFTSASDKINKLHDLLIQESTIKAIVFDDTHRSVEKLSKELDARGLKTDSLHGGKSQSQRQRVLDSFRNNRIKILVATDVASRGLDVADISHVINYSSPQTYDDYVHRIGRTGRTGKIGYALTFLEQ